MRGDQVARQWRVIRAIESRPNGLTVSEIAKQEETEYGPSAATRKPPKRRGFPCIPRDSIEQIAGFS
jgi:hypothetical protein